MNTKMHFPSLENAIYSSRTIKQAWKNYITELRRDESNLLFCMYANKLQELELMRNPRNLKKLNRDFKKFKRKLQPWITENGINIEFRRRQKDFVGLNQKIRHYINSATPLSKVNDFLGFRIIISSSKDENCNIGFCYQLLQKIIEFFVVEKHCIILEAEPRMDTEFDPKAHPKVIIPNKPQINPKLTWMFKDYIFKPKQNGYQSLHVIFKNPRNMQIFEIQIRTKEMDLRAEEGMAEHGVYKRTRYLGEEISINPNLIKMRGFRVDEDGKIHDAVGLISSIDPFS